MNLDAKINEIGFEIVEAIKKEKDKTKYKNYIDKVLGVLANEGVYAYWVYCKANKVDKEPIKKIFVNKMKPIMEIIDKEKEDEEFFKELSNDLNQLLFFKELVEKALIYARYHAKALKDE